MKALIPCKTWKSAGLFLAAICLTISIVYGINYYNLKTDLDIFWFAKRASDTLTIYPNPITAHKVRT